MQQGIKWPLARTGKEKQVKKKKVRKTAYLAMQR
jgi:hypothetical protein